MEFSIKVVQLSQDDPLYILRGHRLRFPKTIVFLSLNINFVIANSADLDEMPHYAAFHLGLHCLPKYLFRDFWSSKGNPFSTGNLFVSIDALRPCPQIFSYVRNYPVLSRDDIASYSTFRTQHNASGVAQTKDLLISSGALYYRCIIMLATFKSINDIQ